MDATVRSLGPGAVAVLGAALVAPLLGVVPAEAAARRPAESGARIVREEKLGRYMRDLTVRSPHLAEQVKVRILLPANWRKKTKRTWPVLYAFHGGQDGYVSWTRSTDIEKWARRYGVIVVMPEASDGSYTDWHNHGRGGVPRWETFHTSDVVQLVERNYHGGGRRAAIGVSAGGMGSLSYAARHKGLFRYAASLSGILHLTAPGMPALAMVTNAANLHDPTAIYGVPGVDDANWRAHDPYVLAPRLRGVGVFFSAGTTGRPGPGDPKVGPVDVGLFGERAVGQTNRDFGRRLKELGIPHTARLYGDGRHNWPAWRRVSKKLWPTLMQRIGARRL
ncbi:alpha/beta hydrolase [Actinocorallia populi]|uniref:alpha/beta hydrolase n=1 Tax=Actinocorallia populi TaxID=2079200 RepID=UPI001E5378E1|nr:alpha/beta hydrolase-fold protein [Actinocorallia populi]